MRNYSIQDFEENLKQLNIEKYNISMRGKGERRRRYYDVAASFDTETTSLQDKAHTYAMMLSIDNKAEVLLRTWDDTVEAFNVCKKYFNKAILPIYIHNMAFDFAALNGWLEWQEVFSIAVHTPIKALSTIGIEFRDSLVLFAKKLETIGQEIGINKMVGDLDYKLVRHSQTPLTDKEIEYCFKDVEVLVEAIRPRLEEFDMAHIPMTSTGYVRHHVRDYLKAKRVTMDFIHSLTIEDDEYEVLHEAFSGGMTHTNAYYSDEVVEDVYSYDIITSYIASAVGELFPMSKGKKVYVKSMEDFVYYLENYLSVFPITFYNISLKDGMGDTPISISKCCNIENVELDNGRVYKADRITTTITSVDFYTINEFYEFDSFDVKTMWIYEAGRLPKRLIECMLELYAKKTELKGIKGKENEYNRSKELLNAIYGMMVTDVKQETIIFNNGEWEEKEAADNSVSKYNNSPNRFLFYAWGVFISAWSRRHLMKIIGRTGNSHVYCDTDSEKFIGKDNIHIFEEYNKENVAMMDEAMDYFNLDRELTRPKNINGKRKQLGNFEFEHCYKLFKALGAKRYLVQTEDNEIILTVAGTQKIASLEYMLKTCNINYTKEEGHIYSTDCLDGLFEMFDNELYIPEQYTGKSARMYSNGPITFNVVDYMGNEIKVEERGCCVLKPVGYSLGMEQEYIKFALGVKEYRTRNYF